jgi:hypothetical protein
MSNESRRQFITFGAAAAWVATVAPAWARDGSAPAPSADTSGTRDSSPYDAFGGEPVAASLIPPTHTLLASTRAPALAPFLAEWPAANAALPNKLRPVEPSTIPVLRYLPDLNSHAPAFGDHLVHDIVLAAPFMAWRRTYTEPDVSAAFLQNYGWSEIVGTSGPLASEKVACGFLILGPQTLYPSHRHEAEEIYIPLVGTASWQQGDGPWAEYAPGTVIHHDRNETHAMRTGTSPLLGLYLWRSADLRQKAHFVR